MSYIGKWKFHSIGTVDDETYERVWLNGEEYMNSPMPYIDETDEKSVADEMKERKKTVGMLLEVCEDGNLYQMALRELPNVYDRYRQYLLAYPRVSSYLQGLKVYPLF